MTFLQRRRDFLQLILDARSSANDVSTEHFDTVNQTDVCVQESEAAAGQALPKKEHKTLSDDEIVGQTFLFLIAGYETTNSTLSFATYLLATNPECQEKLLREVDEFFAKHVSRHLAYFIFLYTYSLGVGWSPSARESRMYLIKSTEADYLKWELYAQCDI